MYRNRKMGHRAHFFPKTILGVTLSTSALILSASISATTAHAQTDTARIAGTVQDATGATIPGATVTVTNTSTNAEVTATSDSTGAFTVNALPIGPYKAAVTATGFASQTQNFTLSVSQTQSLAFKLAIGSESTTVEVTSAAPLVESDTSSLGETIEGRQVTELPLNGRNFTGLALLTPGVTRGNYGNSASGVNGDAETFRNSFLRRRFPLHQRPPPPGQQLHSRRHRQQRIARQHPRVLHQPRRHPGIPRQHLHRPRRVRPRRWCRRSDRHQVRNQPDPRLRLRVRPLLPL